MPSVLLLGKILKWSRETPQLPRPGLGLTWVAASRIVFYLRSEQGNDAKQLFFTANIAEQSLRSGVKLIQH